MTALATPLASLAATPLPPAAGEVARGGGSVSGGSPPLPPKPPAPPALRPCRCHSPGCADPGALQPVIVLRHPAEPDRLAPLEGTCYCVAHALRAAFGLRDLPAEKWRELVAKHWPAPTVNVPALELSDVLFKVIP